jgi:hypothetical protein
MHFLYVEYCCELMIKLMFHLFLLMTFPYPISSIFSDVLITSLIHKMFDVMLLSFKSLVLTPTENILKFQSNALLTCDIFHISHH